MHSSRDIAFAHGAHTTIVILRVQDLSLLLDSHLTEHLIELVVGLRVLPSILNQLLGEQAAQVFLHLQVDLVPLINGQLGQLLLLFIYDAG